MERRIKTLYTVTIIAILAFLGMQVYWLYGRYEYSLIEYERSLGEQIGKVWMNIMQSGKPVLTTGPIP